MNARGDAHGIRAPAAAPSGALLLPFLLLFAGTARAAGTSVDVRFDPPRVVVGEAADLTLTVDGQAGGSPSMPAVDGLHIDFAGRSSRMEVVNGRTTRKTIFHYRVWAERPGRYAVPALRVSTASGVETTPPVTLEVVKAPRRAVPAPSGRGLPPGRSTPAPASPRADVSAFLRVRLDRTSPFVGETVPLAIEAWFPADAGGSLDALPHADEKAFTLDLADTEAKRSSRELKGRLWKVLTWQGALSAVKAGRFPLRFSMEATLQVRDRRPRRRGPSRRRSPFGGLLGGDPFDDPFFQDDLFSDLFSPVRQVKVEPESEPLDLVVRPLPAEGRPVTFHGAVGRFTVEAFLDPAVRTSTVGDPLTLVTVVRGEGSFDRVRAPVLEDETGWKTYPPDHREGKAEDQAGEKTFEQVIVPTDASIQAVPPVVLSYFDPVRETYETARTVPIPLRLVPAPLGRAPRGEARPVAGEATAPASAEQDALVPDRVGDGGAVSTLVPWIRRPVSAPVLGGLGLLLGAGLVLTVRRRRRERDPVAEERRRRERAIARARADLDHAVARGDQDAAVAAARRALCDRLARDEAQCEPSSLTLADVEACWPDAPEAVAEAFEALDAVTYGGAGLGGGGLASLQDAVRRAVEALDVREDPS
ncbi:MAG: BatD family protein [Planctomycetota bacterium]